MGLAAWLFAISGLSLSQLADALSLDQAFLGNVAGGRQPMPIDVAAQVAAYLATNATTSPCDVSTVLAQCPTWTPLTGPAQRRSVPPDPLSPFSVTTLAPTQPVLLP